MAQPLRQTGRKALFVLLLAALAACAPQTQRLRAVAPVAPASTANWAFARSDVPVDPDYRFGSLDNGMRYVVRRNATPAGTALVRMEIAAGSLDESDDERGFAHFVEHMAFNGSDRVPEGEMVRLLERRGLAFGADTNATTSYDRTTYLLDLPRNDPALLDTALMLMRETASALTFSPAAVERERGVVLAEMRDRQGWQLSNLEDQIGFFHRDARYVRRLPIGTSQTVSAATADTLKAFWQREYVPAQTTVIVIGDFPPAEVEAMIRAHFADWRAKTAQARPDAGPVDPGDAGRTRIHIDPALSERVTASRNGPWLDEPDTLAQRREDVLRQIGYAIVNRRFQRLSRQADPPFRAAGFGTGEVFRAGRSTNLIVDSIDRKWQRGLETAAREYRRALEFGFTPAEVAEQVANLHAIARNQAASEQTRSNSALVDAVYALLRNDVIPATPQGALERLEAFIPEVTPEVVLDALKREAVPLEQPLLRFQGRNRPAGGAQALRESWNRAMAEPLAREEGAAAAAFGYGDFGPPGVVTSDQRTPELGIRTVRFANGVRLNIKRTEIERERVTVQLSLDGGDMLNTRENPTATAMAANLPLGGLGKHSQDELETILAGRTVGASITSAPDAFVVSARTTPRDLELQLQLFAAYIIDPGFRPEGERRYWQGINDFFARLRATPFLALTNAIGGILSDNDPRFSLQPVEAYRRLTFARLKADIADRLAAGVIEIGVVGDVDEAQVIALVGRTLGALPPREADFRAYPKQRQRPFTADRSPRVLRHTGPANQALLRYTWPTRDDSDQSEVIGLLLLERLARIELTETLREKLGKAYSPSASSAPSHAWTGYGVFGMAASVDVHEVPAARLAIVETVAALCRAPVDDDLLQRARQPLIEAHDNALKSNAGWMALTARAQSEADRLVRYQREKDMLLAQTPARLQALACRYLDAGKGLEILVLPEGVEPPRVR